MCRAVSSYISTQNLAMIDAAILYTPDRAPAHESGVEVLNKLTISSLFNVFSLLTFSHNYLIRGTPLLISNHSIYPPCSKMS